MIVSNMYPSLTYEQRQQLLHFFHHQKAECERALQKLSEEVIRDRYISKIARRKR